jgi:hypothetical protein
MFGEPLVADESQVRFRPFARPRHARRKGTEDRQADDDPPDVHRQVSLLFFFATIREYWIRNGEHVRKGTVSSAQLYQQHRSSPW